MSAIFLLRLRKAILEHRLTLGVAELREANLEAGVLFLRLAPYFALFYAKSKGDIILAVVLSLGPAFLLRREEGPNAGFGTRSC